MACSLTFVLLFSCVLFFVSHFYAGFPCFVWVASAYLARRSLTLSCLFLFLPSSRPFVWRGLAFALILSLLSFVFFPFFTGGSHLSLLPPFTNAALHGCFVSRWHVLSLLCFPLRACVACAACAVTLTAYSRPHSQP